MSDTAKLETARVELHLEITQMVVAAGTSGWQKIKLVNLSPLLASFDLSLAGIPLDWYQFSQTALNLFPNWNEAIDLEIKVPAGMAPAHYNLQIIVSAQSDENLRTSTRLELEIPAPDNLGPHSPTLPTAGELTDTSLSIGSPLQPEASPNGAVPDWLYGTANTGVQNGYDPPQASNYSYNSPAPAYSDPAVLYQPADPVSLERQSPANLYNTPFEPSLSTDLTEPSSSDAEGGEAESGQLNVQLPTREFQLKPGEDFEQQIDLQNMTTTPNNFEVRLQGWPSDWYSLSQTTFNLFPNWSEKIDFKITIPTETEPAPYPAQLVITAANNQDPIRIDLELVVQGITPLGASLLTGSTSELPVVNSYSPNGPAPAQTTKLNTEHRPFWQRLLKKDEPGVDSAQTPQPYYGNGTAYYPPNTTAGYAQPPSPYPYGPTPIPGQYASPPGAYPYGPPTGPGPVPYGLPPEPVETPFTGNRPTTKLYQAPPSQATLPLPLVGTPSAETGSEISGLLAPVAADPPSGGVIELEKKPTIKLVELAPTTPEPAAKEPEKPKPEPVEIEANGLKLGVEQAGIILAAGDFLEQQISLVNLTTNPDSFDLKVEGLPEGWSQLSSNRVYLFPNWAEQLYLRIEIPADAHPDRYRGRLVMRSKELPEEVFNEIELLLQTLEAGTTPEHIVPAVSEESGIVELSLETTSLTIVTGNSFEQQVHLHNNTGQVDTFTLSIEGIPADWYSFSCESLTLFPGWSEEFYLRIEVPAYVPSERHPLKIIATPHTAPEKPVEIGLELNVQASLSMEALWDKLGVDNDNSTPVPVQVALDAYVLPTTEASADEMALMPEPPQLNQPVPAERNSLSNVLPVTAVPVFDPTPTRPVAVPTEMPPPGPVYPAEAYQAAPPPVRSPKRSLWQRLTGNGKTPEPAPQYYYPPAANYGPGPYQSGPASASEAAYILIAPQPVTPGYYEPPAAPDGLPAAYYNQPSGAVGDPMAGVGSGADYSGQNTTPVASPAALNVNDLFKSPAAAPRRTGPATSNTKVQITLQKPRLTIIAGETSEQEIGLVNLTSLPDNFDLSIEGLPSNWYKFSQSSVNLFPNWSEPLQLGISLSSKVRPNLYVGKVIAVSRTQPGVRSEVELEIEVLAPLRLEARLQPHRARGYKADYKLVVRNRSQVNGLMTFSLSDSTEFCVAHFTPEKIVVPAGQSTMVPIKMQLRPKTPNDQARQAQPFEVKIEPEWSISDQPVKGPELLVEGQYQHESRWEFIFRHPKLFIFGGVFLILLVLWFLVIVNTIQTAFLLTADRYQFTGPIPNRTIFVEQKAFSDNLQKMNPVAGVGQIEVRFQEDTQLTEIRIKVFLFSLAIRGQTTVDNAGNLIFIAKDPPNSDTFPWVFAPPNKMVDHINKRLRVWISQQAPSTRIQKVEIEGTTLFIRLAQCTFGDPACNGA